MKESMENNRDQLLRLLAKDGHLEFLYADLQIFALSFI